MALAQQILTEDSPVKQKSLGRNIKFQNHKVWEDRRIEIMKTGLLAKFSQNTDLKEISTEHRNHQHLGSKPL